VPVTRCPSINEIPARLASDQHCERNHRQWSLSVRRRQAATLQEIVTDRLLLERDAGTRNTGYQSAAEINMAYDVTHYQRNIPCDEMPLVCIDLN
jgi:hypothetical protein